MDLQRGIKVCLSEQKESAFGLCLVLWLFCNVWVCVCVGVCMCGLCNVWVCVCVGFVMCGCVYVWVL